MKKGLLVCLVLVTCLIMASCESQNVKDAKEAYEKEDYAKVVECLDKEEDIKDDDLIEMKNISYANVKYDEKEYADALESVSNVEEYDKLDVYKNAEEKVVKKAIKKGKVKDLLKAIKACPEIADYAADEVMKACDELNYNGFIVLAKLRKNLSDGEIRDKLDTYYKENKLNKPKAFLIGKWEQDDKEGSIKTLAVKKAEEDMIGVVTAVTKAPFVKGDIYWSKFKFVSVNEFTCNSIGKDYYGGTYDNNALAKIDYKKETISIHLTPVGGHALTGYETKWNRVK